MKKERLLISIGSIDEKYIKEAEPKMKNSFGFKKLFGAVACFAILVAIGLYLFLPYGTGATDLTAYSESDYLPLIEKIDEYLYTPPKYKNNFEYFSAHIKNFGTKFDTTAKDDMMMAPGDANTSVGAPEMDGADNGSYKEVTDNQVEGVIEADIFKGTDKYIFRIQTNKLSVFSIDKESSSKISTLDIPSFDDEYYSQTNTMEMYLSEDANTITLIKPYINDDKESSVGIISIDVSNVKDIKVRSRVSIDGSYKSSRKIDGQILLISEYYFNVNKIDYARPETYVPSINRGSGKECIRFEDIVLPEAMAHNRYSVVALLDESTLNVLGASALLNFTDDIYVSENNVYVTREYNKKTDVSENSYVSTLTTDISIINYRDAKLTKKGIITVAGEVKDQYSLDEYEGHIRIVTSTSEARVSTANSNSGSADSDLLVSFNSDRNVNLYVFSLENNALVAEVKAFAPQGETAESVRFDGDTAYVCTAVVVTFTDPVYFFDLSDYNNITYTDTGVIDGYSTSLINLSEGFLLGIGVENRMYNKIEVYEETADGVVSVDKYLFNGSYSTDYKSYLVNREDNMFGFAVSFFHDEETGDYYDCAYIILIFDGYKLNMISLTEFDSYYSPERIRAAYVDGYVYLTSDTDFKVVALN